MCGITNVKEKFERFVSKFGTKRVQFVSGTVPLGTINRTVAEGIMIAGDVITSYSIHYTKLYDGVINNDDLFLFSFVNLSHQTTGRIILCPSTTRTYKTTALIFEHSSAL